MNQQILLVSRPTGEPTLENLRLVETPLAPLADGKVLVRHHYLSLDPYMRGRMNKGASYAEEQRLNDLNSAPIGCRCLTRAGYAACSALTVCRGTGRDSSSLHPSSSSRSPGTPVPAESRRRDRPRSN